MPRFFCITVSDSATLADKVRTLLPLFCFCFGLAAPLAGAADETASPTLTEYKTLLIKAGKPRTPTIAELRKGPAKGRLALAPHHVAHVRCYP